MTELCIPPDPEVHAPPFAMPPGATDSHFHLFGARRLERLVPVRDYTPGESSAAQARQLFDTLGIDRIVVIQASIFGLDNRDQLEEGAKVGLPMRAVVVVRPDAPEAEYRALHDQGARGIRYILAHPGSLDPAGIERSAERAAAMGWHLQFLVRPEHLVELAPRLMRLPCPVVIDHFGFISPAAGPDHPAFQALLRLVLEVRGYAKVSGAYRISREGPGFADVRPYAEALLAAAPDRILWGSDWPHVGLKSGMPNTSRLLDLLGEWAPAEETRRRILVDNPARLFGF